ncbi:MAG: ATP-binding cassette domain-containing protein [Solirubrobacteraceae bacterium]
MTAIDVEDLHKSFGDVRALAGVNLSAPEGAVLGLLGPNGAGKTTLVRILATLVRPDRGRARVLGHDVVTASFSVRRTIGLAGQFAAVEEVLTGRENLVMVARLYGLPRREAAARAADVLDRFGLGYAADRRAGSYSGGMRRRLDLAATLVGHPRVVFLDEPTSGLDPRSRNDLWALVEDLRSDGTTVLLTTQYLEEADRLADRIAVIDQGQIVADGTSDELKQRVGGERLIVRVADPGRAAAARATLSVDAGPELADNAEFSLPIAGDDVVADAVRRLDAENIRIAGLELRRPTLDDAFLALTGRRADPQPHDTQEVTS